MRFWYQHVFQPTKHRTPPTRPLKNTHTHTNAAMPKELEPSTNEKLFILNALTEGIRLDERELDSFRDLQLEFGKDYGLADVRLGKTRFALRTGAWGRG